MSEKVEVLGQPLTAIGGPVEISDSLRRIVCLLPNHRLLVQRGHELNPFVGALKDRLTKHGYDMSPENIDYVDLQVISSAYEDSRVRISNQSEQQETARKLFEEAAKLGASDIHIICSERNQTRIQFRVHGDLEFIPHHVYPYEVGTQLCTTIYQSMADQSDSVFNIMEKQDARIANRDYLPKQLDSVRISSIGTMDGNSMVLRLLYNSSIHAIDFISLGYTEEQTNLLALMARKPTGCNIFSGPTGSGKSTTLLGMLSKIIKDSSNKKSVITVEDPPEYPIPGARQTAVTNATTEEERSSGFQRAIIAAMRHDPNVIMIGEVRDQPSASLAFEASKTGHAVWTTLHANSALVIPSRLLDLEVQPSDIFDPTVVTGLISQRLIKKLCPHCKVPFLKSDIPISSFDRERMFSVLKNIDQVYLAGEGCSHCRKGVTGRTVLAEVIIPDEQLMSLIRTEKRVEAMNYWVNEMHGITLNAHAITKIEQGLVDPFQVEDEIGLLRPVL